MADHVRKQVRDSITTTVTGLSTTAGRVHKSKVDPVKTLPALSVYVGKEIAESSSRATMGSNSARLLDRSFVAIIEAAAVSEDQAETICKEVEIAMAADPTFSNLAKDSFIVGTEFMYGNGEERSVIAVLSYQVNYHTTPIAPDVAL